MKFLALSGSPNKSFTQLLTKNMSKWNHRLKLKYWWQYLEDYEITLTWQMISVWSIFTTESFMHQIECSERIFNHGWQQWSNVHTEWAKFIPGMTWIGVWSVDLKINVVQDCGLRASHILSGGECQHTTTIDSSSYCNSIGRQGRSWLGVCMSTSSIVILVPSGLCKLVVGLGRRKV